jgi:hypothetical protein
MLLLVSQIGAYSQGTDIRIGKEKQLFLGLSLSPAQTEIANTYTSTIALAKSNKKFAFFGTIDIGYFFSKYFEVSSGIGFSSYSTDLSLDSYTNAFDTTDSENDVYNRRISGSDIKETQKLSFINIPLSIDFQLPLTSTLGFYIQAGIDFSIPVQKSYSSSGTFSYSGYYQAYHVLIENVPYEGFLSANRNNVNGVLVTKSLCQELLTSAGFRYTVKNKFQISLGGFYNKMLSDLSDNSAANSFRLSSVPNQMKSMMQGSSKVTASSLGLKISLSFFL